MRTSFSVSLLTFSLSHFLIYDRNVFSKHEDFEYRAIGERLRVIIGKIIITILFIIYI